MRKLIGMLCVLLMMTACAAGACAAGVTLRVFTPFADVDFAAQGYMDMVTRWEAETGNLVEDYSGMPDDSWFSQMRQMVASGAADVVVLPVGSGLTSAEVITAGELAAAAPQTGAKKFASMAEAGGEILLAPVRPGWEALYVNTDVLERFGLSVPQTFEQLLVACMVLSQGGVLPVANALCEWPEIVLDCAALSGAPQEAYGTQASLDGAKDVLVTLTQVGAFGSDPWNLSDLDAEERFLAGEAAMRIDADGLAQRVNADRQDCVMVVPLPPKDGAARTHAVGTAGFGVAVTRACWQDDQRREAALSFVSQLLAEKSVVSPAGGLLGGSIAALTAGAQDMTGLLYDRNPDGFDSWAESVVAALMSL